MARVVLGILMFLKYGIWNFAFQRKVTWIKRHVAACVKHFSITRHNSPCDIYAGGLHTDGVGFLSNVSVLSRQ